MDKLINDDDFSLTNTPNMKKGSGSHSKKQKKTRFDFNCYTSKHVRIQLSKQEKLNNKSKTKTN